MKELNKEELDKVAGGINNTDNNPNVEKWAKVGIKIVEVNGFAEYYLIETGQKISPKKALEIFNSNTK